MVRMRNWRWVYALPCANAVQMALPHTVQAAVRVDNRSSTRYP